MVHSPWLNGAHFSYPIGLDGFEFGLCFSIGQTTVDLLDGCEDYLGSFTEQSGPLK